MRVLVIAAHPDDETCGAGGMIASLTDQGIAVYLCMLTDGVTARHSHTEMQQQAAREAAAMLGIREVFFHGLPDQRLDQVGLLEVVRPIERHVRELQPDVVLCPPAEDVNQDHRAAFDATMIAVRPTPDCPVRLTMAYEVLSSTEWCSPTKAQFQPDVYFDIASVMDRKLAALEAYGKTHVSELRQFPHPRSLKGLQVYAQQRGLSVGLHCAEAFRLVRAVNWPLSPVFAEQ